MKILQIVNEKKNRKYIIAAAALIYVFISVAFLVRNYMSYAMDEFYALASLAPDWNDGYTRHIYINKLVAWLGSNFGNNYYVMKSIPLVCGLLSYVFFMIILVTGCRTNVAILLGSVVYSFNSLILFNHLYIRHYVFAELAFTALAAGVYVFYSRKGSYIFRGSMMLLAVAANWFYITQTNDDSIWGFEMIIGVLVVLLVAQKPVYYLLNKPVKNILVAIVFCIMAALGYIISNDEIMSHMDPVFRVKFYFFRGDKPVMWYLDILVLGYVVVALIAFLFKDNFNRLKEEYPLWCISFMSVFAYAVAFPKNNMIRTIVPYMGVAIAFGIIFWNRTIEKQKPAIIVSVIILSTVYLSYPNFDFRYFYNGGAGIYQESSFEDYESLSTDVKEAENQGYELVSVMSLRAQNIMLGIEPDVSLAELGDDNEPLVSTEDAVSVIRDKIASKDSFVIYTDNSSGQRLEADGILNELKDKYEYRTYNGTNEYLIYINAN